MEAEMNQNGLHTITSQVMAAKYKGKKEIYK
jgi:hypothetical protein